MFTDASVRQRENEKIEITHLANGDPIDAVDYVVATEAEAPTAAEAADATEPAAPAPADA